MLSRLTPATRRRAFAWIVEGREPTEAEHRLTLTLAATWTKRLAIAWALAAVAFSLINLTHSAGFAAVVLATVWLGGETTCALAYLFYERALRPVTALALAARLPERPIAPGRARAPADRLEPRHRGADPRRPRGRPGRDHQLRRRRPSTSRAPASSSACVALGVGLLATAIAARAIADPVTSVRAALDRVAGGDFDGRGARSTTAARSACCRPGFNRMAEGLREREHIRDLFGRQVGREVARAALRGGARLGGEEREIGAVFVDLVGSTSMALAMPPTEVVRLLNRFFRVVVEVVEAEGGLVNKFEGDAALCVFGAPVASDDPAGDALRAARALAERLEREVREIGFGDRRLGGARGGRQRRRRAALRVHGDRRPGQRGGAPLRARQGARRARGRLRGRAHAGRRRRGRRVGAHRAHRAPRPPRGDRPRDAAWTAPRVGRLRKA